MNRIDLGKSLSALLPVRSQRFGMLLRREIWEHRGSFVWLPLVVSVIALLLTIGAILIPEIIIRDPVALEELSRNSLVINNNMPLRVLFGYGLEPGVNLTRNLNLFLQVSAMPVLLPLAFCILFYCLGALYDDRRDRSVLFWKSIPVTDLETVLSKLVSAVIIAPLLALLMYIAVLFGTLLIICTFAFLRDGDAWLLWQSANPFWISLTQLAALPVYALYLLPCTGWLLLCSAWARSKPFLWALLIPAALGVMFSLLHLGIDRSQFWMEVVLRPFGNLLLPMHGWLDLPPGAIWEDTFIQPGALYRHLATPRLWIGALTGSAMIAAAIALRRWREEV